MKEKQYTTEEKGSKFYYKDPKMKILHREDGPAAEFIDGDKMWFANGKIHRLDGPAIEYAGGDKAWYVDNRLIFEVDENDNIIDRMED